MDVLTNLRTFLTVSRTGGFSEAARYLHVVPSVVAKRIAQLEQTMDAKLFERTTRQVLMTEAGHRLKTRAASLVADLDEVVNEVRRDEGKLEGHIKVMAPTTITLMRLAPLFDSFLAEHDRISLELSLADRSVNPVEEGCDIAISGRSANYEGVVDVPLCPVKPILCASVAYLRRHGTPVHPRELADHDCLVFRPSGSNWSFHSNRGLVYVEVTGRMVADDNRTLTECAINGRGIAVLPEYVCSDALADGRLVPLLPHFPPQDYWFKAYVPRRKLAVARNQALVQWLSSRLGAALGQHEPTRSEPSHENPASERPELEPAGHA